MSHDVGMLRAKLRKALDNIGKNNGHACPQSASNLDPTLHELYVSSEAVAYWKSRHDKARQAALDISMDVDEAVQSVIDTGAGTSVVGVLGELYVMNVDISKPSLRLDSTALRNALQTEFSISKSDVDDVFRDCSKYSAPAKRIKVASR